MVDGDRLSQGLTLQTHTQKQKTNDRSHEDFHAGLTVERRVFVSPVLNPSLRISVCHPHKRRIE